MLRTYTCTFLPLEIMQVSAKILWLFYRLFLPCVSLYNCSLISFLKICIWIPIRWFPSGLFLCYKPPRQLTSLHDCLLGLPYQQYRTSGEQFSLNIFSTYSNFSLLMIAVKNCHSFPRDCAPHLFNLQLTSQESNTLFLQGKLLIRRNFMQLWHCQFYLFIFHFFF